jgi:hypothetical protein
MRRTVVDSPSATTSMTTKVAPVVLGRETDCLNSSIKPCITRNTQLNCLSLKSGRLTDQDCICEQSVAKEVFYRILEME